MTKAILTKDSIDLGIVVCDADASLAFYRDTLGFTFEGEMPMPGGGTMYRVLAGTTLLKLVKANNDPAKAAGGGITGACGYRYFTLSVSNLKKSRPHAEQLATKLLYLRAKFVQVSVFPLWKILMETGLSFFSPRKATSLLHV